MKILKPDAQGIAEAVQALRDGKLVVHATETCYGIACDLTNIEAVKRLFRVKQRPETQPVSALFFSLKQAKQYLEWNDRAEELSKDLPGPLTLILKLRTDAPHQLFPTTNNQQSITTVGLRYSPHPVAQALASSFTIPISTTSANVHGQENPYSAADILAQYEKYEEKPDFLLDSGPLERRKPSKIVDCTGTSGAILRA